MSMLQALMNVKYHTEAFAHVKKMFSLYRTSILPVQLFNIIKTIFVFMVIPWLLFKISIPTIIRKCCNSGMRSKHYMVQLVETTTQ